MFQRCVRSLLIVCITMCFTACSGKPQDNDNKNISVNALVKELSGVDIYYDCAAGMYHTLKRDTENFCEIVYAVAGTARDTWYNSDYKLTLMGKEKEVSFDFFSKDIRKPENYLLHSAEVLKDTFSEINPDHLSLYITDFASQLYNYSELANSLVANALSKNLAVGFIGVELKNDENTVNSIFIIAIADNNNLSKYIDNLKNNPTIVKYSGKQTDFQTDRINKINYQIIANDSGILGIGYENLEFVENGFYPGPDGNIDRKETKGSFTSIRKDYTPEHMKEIIEGTVNFSPNVPKFVNIKNKTRDKKDNKDDTNIISKGTPVYMGVKSLIYEPGENIAGKIKVRVPFNVINGVKLSKIECNLSLDTYISKGGKFVSAKDSDITVELTKKENKDSDNKLHIWQVDDKTNSVILNIFVPDAGKLPIENGVVKLDVTFRHNDTIESASDWIQNWDERGCKNLQNFFASIYTYQKDDNVAENKLTVYLATGEKNITNRIERRKESRDINE